MNKNTSSASSLNSTYVPGVCNINSAEIARRRRTGYFGLAIFVSIAAPLLLFDLPRLIRVILFVPVFLATIGFLQAYYKFCVGYGAAGIQKAAEGDEIAQEIVNKAALELDQKRTRKINAQAVGIALLVTAAALMVP